MEEQGSGQGADELRIATQQGAGFLRIVVTGPLPTDAEAFYARTLALARDCGQTRLLVDVRQMQGRPGHQQTHEFVARNYTGPSGRRTAVLDLPHLLGRDRFYETMVQNRGYDTRLFKDEAEAIAWLLS